MQLKGIFRNNCIHPNWTALATVIIQSSAATLAIVITALMQIV